MRVKIKIVYITTRFITKNGRKLRKQTTKGWYFEVQWRDGRSSWVPLRELKETNPIQVAEYAKTAHITHEPAIVWWYDHTVKKRDQIIAKVKARSMKKTHKYGIQIPSTVLEAYAIDAANNNTYWTDAINEEMRNFINTCFTSLMKQNRF